MSSAIRIKTPVPGQLGKTPGQLLREARERHLITQSQLAARARTTQSAISRIEHDQTSPTVETLRKLIMLTGERLTLQSELDSWGHDRTILRSNLALEPSQRVRQGVRLANTIIRTHRDNSDR